MKPLTRTDSLAIPLPYSSMSKKPIWKAGRVTIPPDENSKLNLRVTVESEFVWIEPNWPLQPLLVRALIEL